MGFAREHASMLLTKSCVRLRNCASAQRCGTVLILVKLDHPSTIACLQTTVEVNRVRHLKPHWFSERVFNLKFDPGCSKPDPPVQFSSHAGQ